MTEKKNKNEFEDLDSEEEVPTNDFDDVPQESGDSMLAAGQSGEVYDWHKAPEGVKAPPRQDLDGQVVVINKAEIILPAKDKLWDKTKAKDKEFKYCTFVLHYEKDGQQEFYSGVRVFKREENGVAKYSHPTITRDRNNQASTLLGIYADFKEKDINEVSLKEFLAFLNSKPKAKIKVKTVKNPQTEEEIQKNMVGEFVN